MSPLTLRLVLLVGLMAACALAVGAGSIEAARVELSELQAGRLLYKAGRLREARALLERVQPENEDERIERLFLLGLIDARLGFFREAARRFETILAHRPKLTRVRLELARIYDALGRDEKARIHFEASLADDLPSRVEEAVEEFLNRIDARQRRFLSVSLALLPETNPNKRTSRRVVSIGGVPFELSEGSRQSSGLGGLITLGASLSPMLTDDVWGILAASAGAKLYRKPDWNDVSVSGELGLAWLSDKTDLSSGLRLGHGWLPGDFRSHEAGPWMRWRRRLTPGTRLEVSLSAGKRSFRRQPGRDGWRFSLKPAWTHARRPATAIETNLEVEIANAAQRHHRSHMTGLGITLRHAFAGGFSVSSNVRTLVRHHRGPDPLFGKVRRDRQLRVAVNLLHRALQIEGFAPYTGYFFEWNHSNIPIHNWRNHGATFGISRTF